MNWNDTDYRAWVCEQLGVDYDGLPLSHSLKQRFLAMAQKAALVYPGPLARRNVNLLMTKPAAPVLDTADAAENALISQYDRELVALQERKARFSKMADAAAEKVKALAKKRAAVAKALGITPADNTL